MPKAGEIWYCEIVSGMHDGVAGPARAYLGNGLRWNFACPGGINLGIDAPDAFTVPKYKMTEKQVTEWIAKTTAKFSFKTVTGEV